MDASVVKRPRRGSIPRHFDRRESIGSAPVSAQLDPQHLGDHVDRMYRAALALTGSPADAEDLVQEAFARVLARPRFLRKGDELGYLLRVMRNLFLDQRRQAARRQTDVTPPEDLETIGTPSDAHARLEAHEVLALVARLPPDSRDVIVAVDVVGLSYKEAARALKVPVGTIMSRLSRAREQVADRMGL
jgi:RNA polymerase sigma-70 factor (ECF subfamily)